MPPRRTTLTYSSEDASIEQQAIFVYYCKYRWARGGPGRRAAGIVAAGGATDCTVESAQHPPPPRQERNGARPAALPGLHCSGKHAMTTDCNLNTAPRRRADHALVVRASRPPLLTALPFFPARHAVAPAAAPLVARPLAPALRRRAGMPQLWCHQWCAGRGRCSFAGRHVQAHGQAVHHRRGGQVHQASVSGARRGVRAWHRVAQGRDQGLHPGRALR